MPKLSVPPYPEPEPYLDFSLGTDVSELDVYLLSDQLYLPSERLTFAKDLLEEEIARLSTISVIGRDEAARMLRIGELMLKLEEDGLGFIAKCDAFMKLAEAFRLSSSLADLGLERLFDFALRMRAFFFRDLPKLKDRRS